MKCPFKREIFEIIIANLIFLFPRFQLHATSVFVYFSQWKKGLDKMHCAKTFWFFHTCGGKNGKSILTDCTTSFIRKFQQIKHPPLKYTQAVHLMNIL